MGNGIECSWCGGYMTFAGFRKAGGCYYDCTVCRTRATVTYEVPTVEFEPVELEVQHFWRPPAGPLLYCDVAVRA